MNNIFNKIILMIAMFSFASCGEWLNLKPENQATSEQLFAKGDGYRAVLNGLYKGMSNRDLYGVELQFGVIDCMSRQYNLRLGQEGRGVSEKYVAAQNYDFKNNQLIPAIEEIWKKGFNVIANANNLIQSVENENVSVFERGQEEKNLILGEAYACRALMHFDLLRIFAPAPVNDDGGNYVPYVDVYPNILANGIAVKPFLERVIKDLETAAELTKEFDLSTFGQGASSTGKARFKNEFDSGWGDEFQKGVVNDFFKGRGYRLSYYAITALQARVYQYAGYRDKAFEAAKRVLEFEAKAYDDNKYQMFSKEDFNGFKWEENPEYYTDLKAVTNLIFGVYNEKAYEDNDLGLFFMKRSDGMSEGNWLQFDFERQKIFINHSNEIDESNDDIRYSRLVFQASSYAPISAKWYISDDTKRRDDNVSIMPIIRATEMRYIMAEEYARNGKMEEAYMILNEIRGNRNVWTPLRTAATYELFQVDMINDAQREWMSEGQLLYLYKRLNANVNMGGDEVRPLRRDEYMFPIPSNQSL